MIKMFKNNPSGLLLHDPLNGSIDSLAVSSNGSPVYVPGYITAQALRIGYAANNRVSYPSQYFDPYKGTLAFWVQPLNFSAIAPTTAPTIALAGVTGLVSPGTHSVVIAAVTAGGVSFAGPPSNAVNVVVGNQQITVSRIPALSGNITGYNVYMTKANTTNNVYYLVGTATTTTFTINLADSSLGAGPPTSLNMLTFDYYQGGGYSSWINFINYLAFYRNYSEDYPNLTVTYINWDLGSFLLDIGTWGHVAFTWMDTTLRYYFNGALVGEINMLAPFRPGYRLRLGYLDTPTLAVAINDLYIWDYPLVAADIATLYSSGTTPVLPGPKAIKVHKTFYPGINQVKAYVDISHAAVNPNGRTVDISIIKPDATTAVLGSITSFTPKGLGIGEFALPTDMSNGNATIKAQLKDSTGMVIGTEFSETFAYKTYPWVGTNVGVSDAIPLADPRGYQPYSALTYDAGTRALGCWGRSYVLKTDGLPDHIVSRSATMTAPMTLIGRINGAAVTLVGSVVIDSQVDGKITFHSSTSVIGATILVSGTMEYDGYLTYTITVTPTSSAITINDMRLEMPINLVNALLYHVVRDANRTNCEQEYLPGQWASPQTTGKIWGSLPGKTLFNYHRNWSKGSFAPYWWIGDYDRGLCWMADNDQNWSLPDTDDAIEFWRDSTYVTAKILFVKTPVVATSANPWSVTFGIMAGPAKPEYAGWRGDPYDSSWWNGASGDPTYGDVSRSFEGYPAIPKMVDFKNYIINVKGGHYGVNFTPHDDWGNPTGLYQGSSGVSSGGDAPENDDCRKEWRGFCDPIADQEGVHKSRFDCMLYYFNTLMTPTNLIDGIYCDNSWPTMTNKVTDGGAYVRRDGTVQPGYNITALRSFYKRSAYLFRLHGSPKRMDVHVTGAMVLPCYNFWDKMRGQEGAYNVPGNNWIGSISLGFICALWMGRQHGMAAVCHAMPVSYPYAGDGGNSLNTLLLLHDVGSRTMTRQGQAMVSFGIADASVQFLGYWVLQAGGGSTGTGAAVKDIKMSAWTRSNGTALVVLGNLTTSSDTRSWTLPFSLLGVDPVCVICDGETYNSTTHKYTRISTSATVSLTVSNYNFRVLLVGPDGTFN